AVEFPVRGDPSAHGIPDEDRTRVARPDPVGRDAEEVDLPEIDPHLLQKTLRLAFHRRVLVENADALGPREDADDLAGDPGDRLESAGPGGFLGGPGDP